MSGGHFNYDQYHIGYIADSVEQLIRDNDRTDKNGWGEDVGRHFPPDIIESFKDGLKALRVAQVYAQRIDWLVSCDDGEDAFRRRLAKELDDLK